MRAGREVPASLTGPEIPAELEYLWLWFGELEMTRRYTQTGPEALGYTEIAAWASLTNRHPMPHEVEALVMLDITTRSVGVKAQADG